VPKVRRHSESRARKEHTIMLFVVVTLTLTQFSLIYELNLDILKTYLHTENDVSRLRLSKVRSRTRQTERQTDRRLSMLAPSRAP